eukprot:scaffold88888_cov55-Attheya_sp.AAC.5
MILAVGPGTPASVVMPSLDKHSSSGESASDDEDDEDDNDEEDEPERTRGRSHWVRSPSDQQDNEEEEEDDGMNDDAQKCSTNDEVGTAAGKNAGKLSTVDEDDDNNDEDVVMEEEEDSRQSRSRRRRSNASEDEEEEEEEEESASIRGIRHSDMLEAISAMVGGRNNAQGRFVIRSIGIGRGGGPANLGDHGDDQDELPATSSLRAPSMRHGGCINTAAWLDCPWRLSLASAASNHYGGGMVSSSFSSNHATMMQDDNDDSYVSTPVYSDDCPTQLVTSGDDTVVKFWDAREAMGSTSPLHGGRSTLCPFSGPIGETSDMASNTHEWEQRAKQGYVLPGMVTPLATLHTGHRGNVFHVTPIASQPGKVLTSGADGYVRLSDVQHQSISSSSSQNSSTVVMSPEFNPEDPSLNQYSQSLRSLFASRRGSMCFSHHFIDQHAGLVCSERGLRRFDLRLPPREQMYTSLLIDKESVCKSCAVWSVSSSGVDRFSDADSVYFFAGGASADVALYDLRMTDGTSSKIVQQYRPRCFGVDATVSVSGLDISRDKKELLVSYENDQIYTFPISPDATSAAGPTADELSPNSDNETSADEFLPELASYGGHLNRLTFLKNAKFAGPSDEYICTGSDSGHAWIYEKATGAVVSLLNADSSTCNACIPHPTLPYFITYGIDSTAKLWRATPPVDPDVDDSPSGRREYYRNRKYEKSPLVAKWEEAKAVVKSFDDDDSSFGLMPDEIPLVDTGIEEHILGALGFFRSVIQRHQTIGRTAVGSERGNNLRNLPDILRNNYFSCVRAKNDPEGEPVRSGKSELKRRVSLIRLRHQADQLGLSFNSSYPWKMHPKKRLVRHNIEKEECKKGKIQSCLWYEDVASFEHAADSVPECPSDWIPFDNSMTQRPKPAGIDFNMNDYSDIVGERYGIFKNIDKCVHDGNMTNGDDVKVSVSISGHPTPQEVDEVNSKENMTSFKSVPCGTSDGVVEDNNQSETGSPGNDDFSNEAWDSLFETTLLLKESGNAALRSGSVSLAAYSYDKALRYCAVAFMNFPSGNSDFLSCHQHALEVNSGHEVVWTPLLNLMITVRLNLAMVLLKPELRDHAASIDQANLALVDLKPFATTKGKVLIGKKLEDCRENEPHKTYTEAKHLQAKAYFRLGTAQHNSTEFSKAARSFMKSVRCAKEANPSADPDSTLLMRLAEAKRAHDRTKERQRKKFKTLFSGEEDEKDGKKKIKQKSQDA